MNNKDVNINSLKPKIYVACLAAYNNGYLHGAWIDANQSVSDIQEEINTMLAKSPIPNAEEWAIHDYEDFGNIHLEEYAGLKSVVAMVKIIAEHGELGAELIAHYSNCLEDVQQALEEYCGEYDSQEDYAKQLMDDCYEVPEYLEFYIDYNKFARDLFISDNFSIDIRSKCHVFRCI